jgi:hypothetical protein
MSRELGPAEKTALLRILMSQSVADDGRRLVDSLIVKRLVFATPKGLGLTSEGRWIALEEARSRNLLTASAR